MKNWEQAWLVYQPVKDDTEKEIFRTYYIEEKGRYTESIERELAAACQSLFGITPERVSDRKDAGLVLEKNPALQTGEEGFRIRVSDSRAVISSAGDKGLLYGTFRLLLKAAAGEKIRGLDLLEKPENPFRMLNMWDNIDGTIERGYAGYSFLYEKGEICVNERTRDFARLLASAGINAIAINNVNVRDGAEWLITERHRENLKALAEVFAEYGVSMYLCIDFAAPMTFDGLSLSDPLDTQVRQWW